MARHVIVKDIPDCPKCGREMTFHSRFDGEATPEHPYGTCKMVRTVCEGCGYEGEEVPFGNFDYSRWRGVEVTE